MGVVTPTPTHPTLAAAGTPVPSPCQATALRGAINGYVATQEGHIQLAGALMEQLQGILGNGAWRGGIIAAATGLSVSVAALTALVGTWVQTDASTTVGGLTPSTTNSLWLRQDGTFTVTTGAAPSTSDGHGAYLLWGTATTDAGSVTAVSNNRTWVQSGYVAIAGSKSDADYTLADTEHTCKVIKCGWTGWATGRNLVVPLYAGGVWTILNATGQTLTVKAASGTGVAIASTKAAQVLCDGTNVVRLTADA